MSECAARASQRPQVTAFFCDDVREEKSGLTSIVGVYPDNIQSVAFPLVFPKLALHVRCVVPLPAELDEYVVKIKLPDVAVQPPENRLGKSEITKLLEAYAGSDSPIGTIVTTMQFASAGFDRPGRVTAEVTINGETSIVAILNVRMVPDVAP